MPWHFGTRQLRPAAGRRLRRRGRSRGRRGRQARDGAVDRLLGVRRLRPAAVGSRRLRPRGRRLRRRSRRRRQTWKDGGGQPRRCWGECRLRRRRWRRRHRGNRHGRFAPLLGDQVELHPLPRLRGLLVLEGHGPAEASPVADHLPGLLPAHGPTFHSLNVVDEVPSLALPVGRLALRSPVMPQGVAPVQVQLAETREVPGVCLQRHGRGRDLPARPRRGAGHGRAVAAP
mmetsp:Transcript_48526/g.150180  ORF Transcript_48526/g.150180 Transcript_48526/m.150180 type:complete len:230 (+) Transcript_48526:1957-2646(+)